MGERLDPGLHLIHRQYKAEPPDTALVTQCLFESFSQRQADIFHRVVIIDMQVTVDLQLQAEAGMSRDLIQNVIKKTDPGVDLIATPQLKLQLGDRVTVVGTELAIAHTEKVLGNQMKRLNYPNLIPIFLGIMLGCIVANIPFFIPGINENLRLGLTGGPLVVAILIG